LLASVSSSGVLVFWLLAAVGVGVCGGDSVLVIREK